MGWRDHLKVHPAAELFPMMSESELRELGEDIKKHGMRYPVVFWESEDKEVYLLDGRNRLDAMELVGVPAFDDDGKLHHWSLRSGDPRDLVVSLNIHRRHLNVEQRQELLITLIARNPKLSNRQIAKKAGVDHKTIGKARAKGEELGSVPQLEKTTGKDGKQRKAKKSAVQRTGQHARADSDLKSLDIRTGSAEVSIEQRRADHAHLADPENVADTAASRSGRRDKPSVPVKYCQQSADMAESLSAYMNDHPEFEVTPELIKLATEAAGAWFSIKADLEMPMHAAKNRTGAAKDDLTIPTYLRRGAGA